MRLQLQTDEEIQAKADEIDEWRAAGVDNHELPDSAIAVLHEAQTRKLQTKFPFPVVVAEKVKMR